jgi:hypothetical protein
VFRLPDREGKFDFEAMPQSILKALTRGDRAALKDFARPVRLRGETGQFLAEAEGALRSKF